MLVETEVIISEDDEKIVSPGAFVKFSSNGFTAEMSVGRVFPNDPKVIVDVYKGVVNLEIRDGNDVGQLNTVGRFVLSDAGKWIAIPAE